ncbi:hypothetical protein NQ314_021381 [Rhamnusium bicolor]|uniref:DDE Tnp4 domain-containing protein n=1 Tax=Rhamnusium bicolor TaxID=1586634 RepID=A0AAV8WHL4_9CUCU|nr:hypothetical protein NQ314_021381 [Rhamnusium bicolor]
MVDIGASGRQSDGGVFKTSTIGNGFENKLFNLPTAKSLCEDGQGYAVPYVLVGDEAFQCRRLVENTFGIMASRFRLFRKPIIATIDNVIKYVQATTCLNNYIINGVNGLQNNLQHYIPPGYVDYEAEDGSLIGGEWRNEPDPISFRNINGAGLGSNRSSLRAAELRKTFANYFVSDEGSINWQWDNI